MRVALAGLILGLAAGAAGPGPPARAQAPTPPGLSRQELAPARRTPPPRPRPDVFSRPPEGPCPLSGSDVRVTLTSVTFRGLTAATPQELAPAYADLLGREGPVSSVCQVRDRVSEALFRRGILARVEVPEQRIAGGELTLEVIEAHIVNVRVRGDPGPAAPLAERYAEKLRGMAPFHLDKAQRYILLASDIPGLRVRASIRPNAQGERGAVDLDLTFERDPVTALVSVQNLQSEAAGPWGVLGRLDLRSFTPVGERTSLIAYRSFEDEQWVVQALEEVRLGGEGLTGRVSLAYGESRPGDVLEPLQLKIESFIGDVGLAYPVVRKRRQNLTLAAGLEWVDQSTAFRGGGRLSEDNLRVAYVRLEGDLRRDWRGRPLLLNGALSLRKGLSAFGASKAGEPFLSRPDADPEALVVALSAGALAGVADRLTISVRVEAQHTNDSLLVYEELPIGNFTIGRGYDPASLSGDTGVAAAFEVRTGPFSLGKRIIASPYVFYDVARVEDNDPFGFSRTVASVGAGAQIRIGPRATLDVLYARPLDAPFPGAPRPDDRVLITLTATFL